MPLLLRMSLQVQLLQVPSRRTSLVRRLGAMQGPRARSVQEHTLSNGAGRASAALALNQQQNMHQYMPTVLPCAATSI